MDAREFVDMANRALEVGFAGEITTSTADATAQQLIALQSTPFIQVSMSKSALFALIPESNKKSITTHQWKIPRLVRVGPRTSGGLGETAAVAAGNRFTVTFDERLLTPKPYEMGMVLSRRFTWDNVERTEIENTLRAQAAEQFADDLERAAILSDTGGSDAYANAPGLDTTIDGYSVKLGASANQHYSAGAYVGEALFQDIINTLPVERRGNGAQTLVQRGYAFWAPVDVCEAWVQRLQRRATDLGDMSLLDDGRAAYRKIPLNAIPHFPTDLDGVAGHEMSAVTSTFCEIWLSPPERFWIAYNPVMFVHQATDVETGKLLYTYLYTAFDVNVDIPEDVVVSHDVRPSVDTS